MTQRSTDVAQMSKVSQGSTAAVSERYTSLNSSLAELVAGSKSLTQARKMLITCCFSTKLQEKRQLENLLKAVFQSKRSAVSKCFYHPEVKNISADASQHLLARTASVANKTCFIYLQVESGYGAIVEF